MSQQIVELSKFLSYVLRHQPESIGLTLDREGWADISQLIASAAKSGKRVERNLIEIVANTSSKKRFAISEDGMRIRAVQGHSSESVAIRHEEKVPPEFLYHGTAAAFLESIYKFGLQPRSRQYVHLSEDEQTAIAVGRRHGKPFVLKVPSLLMHAQGFTFFRAENGVWLIPSVPPEYLPSFLA